MDHDEMSGVRWLITGADGQLGASLLAQPPPPETEWIGRARRDLDITDPDQIDAALDELCPAVVVNTAAHTRVDDCESDRERAWVVNAEAPATLAARCAGRALLVHLSTEYVFSGESSRPIPEDAPVLPQTVYGLSKEAGERGVRAAGGEHLIVRSQWLFGPGRNFVRTILEAGRRGEPLRVVEDQLGRPTETGALARGIVAAVESGLRDTLHIACEGIASWYDFARQILAEGARRGLTEAVPVEPVSSAGFPRPAPRPAYGVLGLERARAHGIRLPHWSEVLECYLDEEAKRHA